MKGQGGVWGDIRVSGGAPGRVGGRFPGCEGDFQQGSAGNAAAEDEISQAVQDGICAMDRRIKGFADPDTLLSGVESRTSSPVRICRDENFRASVPWIYPCGEGAGYAGGITSAAMDGLKTAEAVIRTFSSQNFNL